MSNQTAALMTIDTECQGREVEADHPVVHNPFRGDATFWITFIGLSLAALISALDTSILATALPTIVADLDSGSNYVWILNVYLLTTATVQPACGQLADVLGRRWPMLFSVMLFLLGSGISGGSRNTASMLAGRVIQGLGNGGICTLVEIIISDLVPLTDRSTYFGLIFAIVSVGTSFGPFVGGALAQHSTWRWVFWINLPIAGLALAILVVALKETRQQESASKGQKFRDLDYCGNVLVVGSTIAITFALITGGNLLSWKSARVIAPLVIGLVGLVVFCCYESMSFRKKPLLPPRFFKNLDASIIFLATFLSNVLTMWAAYFLPFYFQAVQQSSPTRAGVQMLPFCFTLPVACVVGGGLLAKVGHYKIMHIFSFTLFTVCFGCSSLLTQNTNTIAWVLLQIGLALSSGLLMGTLLPALQATLSDADTAAGVSVWAYLRTLGSFWGVTIPATIFTGRFDSQLGLVPDPALQATLSNGRAYQLVSGVLLRSIPSGAVRETVIELYTRSLAWSWYIGVAFAGVGFLACCVQHEGPLKSPETGEEQEQKSTDDGT